MNEKRMTSARALALTSKIVGNDPKIASQLLIVIDEIRKPRRRNERKRLKPKDVNR